MNPRLIELLVRYHAKREMAALLKAGQVFKSKKRWSETGFQGYRVYPSRRKWPRADRNVHYSNDPMRKVGRVLPEFKRSDLVFAQHDDEYYTGWYDNPWGESFKDGSGLVWGLVFQLPARRRTLRFVAAFEFGGTDHCHIDKTRLFEEPDWLDREDIDEAHRCDACINAARWADNMAMEVAEKEKDYQWEEHEKQKEQEDED